MDPQKSSRWNGPQLLLLAAVAVLTLFVVFTVQIDMQLLLRISQQPASSVFKAVTFLGSDHALSLAILLTVIVLYRSKKNDEIVTMIAVGVAAKIFELGLKQVFQRSRPELSGLGDESLGDYSFPSGHSLNSAAIYGFILILALANVRRPFVKLLLAFVGVTIIVAVGVSRVILGVHWASDVLAGWLVAGCLLLVSISLLQKFKREAA